MSELIIKDAAKIALFLNFNIDDIFNLNKFNTNLLKNSSSSFREQDFRGNFKAV